ncbi:MAG: DNA recombination protein RmuC [Salinisphaera sp.]|nr:DNA recombination protein RmuC [Salinisphaera sp.]
MWGPPLAAGLGAAALAALLVWLVLRIRLARIAERLAATKQARDEARKQHDQAQSELRQTQERAAGLTALLEAERKRGEERLADLETARASLTHQFKTLAAEIFEDKSKRFTELNKTNVDALIRPLSERLGEFRQRVDQVYDNEARDRAGLKAEITQLKSLHQRMSEDARRLTSALKGGSKAQGGWGETILKRVFEASGLTLGREYELQVNLPTDTGGRRIPDAVVHLPEGRDVVIDAKVSLVDYERLYAAEDEEERRLALAAHLRSLRAHVSGLAGKEYHAQQGMVTPEFVLMFVPVEGAYIEAMRADPKLHDEALRKNVVILSPSNLLPTLRVVEHMWRVDKQNRNAQIIAQEAGKLYDKFVGFVKDMDELDNRLRQARQAYDQAHRKLATGPGNLVRRTQQLHTLGASSSKRLSDTRTAEQALREDSGAEEE